jgi:ATP-dependent helicase HepA
MKSPSFNFQIGQCWTSEGEPELGVGFVKALDATSIAIEYPSVSQGRLYRRKAPPLRRLEFRVGEKVQSREGTSLVVDQIDNRNDLLYYIAADGTELCEAQLSSKLTLQRPIERFLAGHWDPLKAFSLRRRTLDYYHRHLRSPARGMIGPRVQLLPHQAYVTQEISRRGLPRALLADEVGLGKTIEAAWITHRLLSTERIRRVLIIVPESLVNQWFVELFRRFNLSFWVPASQTVESLEAGDIADQERVILSLESVANYFEEGLLKPEDWDLIIVDEAHRIAWNETEPSGEYKLLQSLAEKTPGLLLLTATPEQLGLAGHFSRLHLIDPLRFPSLAAFEKEHEAYVKVARSIQDSDSRARALDLIDRYGTGRVYFRNARSVVEFEGFSFPKRILQKSVVPEGKEAMVGWLAEFAKAHAKEKSLLICSSAKQVIEWEKRLRDDYALKVVVFHEELSLLARDRNAAYFEDPAGATILLCSEIGGEGRNFQHASHLILADLPEDPDVLEQRIGRLDRIGQASDISIHVPYSSRSETERLLRWHEEVFQAFTSPAKGAREVYEIYRHELAALREKTITKASDAEFEKIMTRAKRDYKAQLQKIEAGRDRLIEINSFDPIEAPKLVQTLADAEKVEELKAYFEDLLDAMGLHSEDLDADSLFVDPGHGQYVSYFPGLPPEGLSFTFSRAKALRRTDLTLMTWDHPMVSETLAQLVGQEFGNVSVAQWEKSMVLVECNFVFEAAATDAKWYADEFFPSTAIRVVLEATGRELTQQITWDALAKHLKPLTPTVADFVKKLPGERIRKLLNQALSQAQTTSTALRQQAFNKMNATIDEEITRLKTLQAKNKLVSETEIQWWNDRKASLMNAFSSAQVRLDSFLLVVPDQWKT